jgi:hypothetical protein
MAAMKKMQRWFHLLMVIRTISGKQRERLDESVRTHVVGDRFGLIFLRIEVDVKFDVTGPSE